MKDLITALAVGFVAGFIFSVMRLPVPAPQAWAGLMGIVGIFLGYKAFQMLKGLF